MEIRAAQADDLRMLADIDATIESTQYFHLDLGGEGLSVTMRIEPRPLRSKLILPNPIEDERAFLIKQIVSGADEGVVTVAEHDDTVVALAMAQPRPDRGTLELIDVRVDYDFRRQGIATAMVYQLIQHARHQELRAVSAETRANNFPAGQMLQKLGFDLGGIDTRRYSNHDVVKETTTLLWYAALE